MLVPGAYIPSLPPPKVEPLSRFLPPVSSGVISSWLAAQIPIQDQSAHPWVLDPFCASPRAVIEAARAGYRIVVAANNPISRFLLDMAANPPTEADLRSALAELAAARKGDERLEPHIRSLYTTRCDVCHTDVMADAFYWDRDKNQPFARGYTCPHCGTSGEHPSTDSDLARLAQFSSSGLHSARALERVAAIDDPDRQHVKEALDVYLPRSLYALFTIINRLDSLPLAEVKKKHLIALILTALDQANTLWQHPTSRARPRQLTIPPRFRESNVWLALESSITLWASDMPPVPWSRWPEAPPATGGVSVFEGRLSDLAEQSIDIQFEAVIAPLPRPNQAFWTLSALWSGWLWGRDALGHFKSVLRRRRYDWGWHSSALKAGLENLNPLIGKGIPVFGLIGENEPGFLTAALVAGESAGFELSSLAPRLDSGQAQIVWKSHPHRADTSTPSGSEIIRLFAGAAREHLRERGEPASFITLQAAALKSAIQQHALDLTPPLADVVSEINNSLDGSFSFRQGFIRYSGSEKSTEIGQWWLEKNVETRAPLSDRVEKEAVRQLIESPGLTPLEYDTRLCQTFTGILTPASELVHVCIQSYGEPVAPEDARWQISKQDSPETRRADLSEISSALLQILHRLNCTIDGDKPMLVYDSHGELLYAIHVIASAVIGDIILANPYAPQKSLLVLPGGRANLVAYKLQHDPRLRQAVEAGWRFLKYRQIRLLLQTPTLTRASLDDQITQDSLTYDAPQLRLF